jgi:hypothetical protein
VEMAQAPQIISLKNAGKMPLQFWFG